MRNLSEIRTEIDSIDEQIIELFKKRMDCAKEVGNYKKANNIPVLNQARENEILDAIEERGGEYGSYARLLYSNIMELSRALQHNIVGSGADIKEVISNVETEIPKTDVKVGYQALKELTVTRQQYACSAMRRHIAISLSVMFLTQLIKEKLHSVYFLLKTQMQARFLPYMT